MVVIMAAPQRWLPTAKLHQLANLGFTNMEIARANERATGYKPTSSAVSKKLAKTGYAPRRMSHKDLIPWTVRPEHSHDPIYDGLQAVSRQRQGIKLSSQDQYRARVLTDLLAARGGPFVVDYRPDVDPEHGFIFVRATAADTDIIRRPKDRDGEGTQ